MTMLSPWLSLAEAASYTKRGRRFLRTEVKAGRLRAAVCGGRRELLFRAEWLDAYLEELAKPVLVGAVRRRA
jgi:excisionase family DNA binding protein